MSPSFIDSFDLMGENMSLIEMINSINNKDFPISYPGSWVDGAWRGEAKKSTSNKTINPSTGEEMMSFSSSEEDRLLAVDMAEKSSTMLLETSMGERLDLLKRIHGALSDYREAIIKSMQLEVGKARWDAELEVDAGLDYLKKFNELSEEDILNHLTSAAKFSFPDENFKLYPVGVTVGFLPFSRPFATFVSYLSASVLSACPLILFSSNHVAVTALLYTHILKEVGTPKEYLQTLFSGYDDFYRCLSDKRVAAVLYVGSYEHCQEITKASRVRKNRQLILQSGGKNSIIVDESSDLDLAVKLTVISIIRGSGQLSSTVSRVFVHDSCLKNFQKKLIAALERLEIGPTDDFEADSGPQLGPLYSKKGLEKFLQFQTITHRESTETLLWGKAVEKKKCCDGFFVSPGVNYVETFDSTTTSESNVILGPTVNLYPYKDLDEAVDMVNETQSPYVVSFIGKAGCIESKRHLIKAPNLLVNLPTVETGVSHPLAGRFSTGQRRFVGAAMALYLSKLQIFKNDETTQKLIESWSVL